MSIKSIDLIEPTLLATTMADRCREWCCDWLADWPITNHCFVVTDHQGIPQCFAAAAKNIH